MANNRVLGWFSLGLFLVALAILLIIPFLMGFAQVPIPFFQNNAQLLIAISGVLGLVAAVTGYFSRRTTPGKIGGIGGFILFLSVAVLLSFTLVTTVQRS